MESKLSRWSEGLIEAGWLAAVVAIPLFFNIHSDRVFEPDKLTLLRSIALVMSAAWLVRFISLEGWRDLSWLRWRDERSIWRRPFVLPVLLLVLVYLISTALSVTPRVSWAGSYQRLQGTYTTLSYVVVFALLLATLRTRAQLERVLTAVIVTSIPIALYAMLQRLGHDPLPWGGNVQRRVAGHMGNAIFIAAYLIMAVPITLARIIDAFSNILGDEELSYADVIRSSIYIFALAVQLIAIYWSGSRGPWIGLGVALFAFVLILLVNLRDSAGEKGRFRATEAVQALGLVVGGVAVLFILLNLLAGALDTRIALLAGAMGSFVAFAGAVGLVMLVMTVLAAARRGWRWLWLSWIAMALLLAAWLFAFNTVDAEENRLANVPIVGNVAAALAEWRELPAIGRLGRILEADEGTGRVRVLIWEGALELIAPHEPLQFPGGEDDPYNLLRPLFGYGPEAMYVAYNKYYPPELATVEARNASPDRSHNETFDALVITGGLGFLVWQFLYLSVFYYGFRWLGVVRSTRDRNILILLWIAGAVVGTVVLTAVLGAVYLGVAIPFGSIGGLVLYLIYFALFSRPTREAESETSDPFNARRLTMVALVAAVTAHYIEIHFGIAIAASRLHFFVYVALMVLVHRALRGELAEEAQPAPTRRRRGRSSAAAPTWVAPVMTAAMLMAFTLAIIGFNFVNLTARPGEEIRTAADVPGSFEIVQRSYLERNGEESPFIYLVLTLTWGLGSLVYLSEMSKRGLISFGESRQLVGNGTRIAAGVFAAIGIASIALLFIRPEATGPPGLADNLRRVLLITWGLLAGWTAVMLFVTAPFSRLLGGGLGGVSVAVGFALLLIGNVAFGLGLIITGLAALYLLWDPSWHASLAPALYMALTSLGIGIFYAIFHASRVRRVVFSPAGATEATSATDLRVLEADQAAGVLSAFYVVFFLLLLILGTIIARPRMSAAKEWSKAPALVGALILLPLAFFFIDSTNLRIIQADIVYKRARPWEQQASRNRDLQAWESAIAIYEHAIELAPEEDFYYLFLGRAYLEQSAITQDNQAQANLLNTAAERLARAQEINPLNTDHTANLARLNVRWAGLTGADERQLRFQDAVDYYQDALALSPQNAVIRNEYAGIAYSLGNDCEEAIEILETSARVDPFYADTKIRLADMLMRCAAEQPERAEQFQEQAIETLLTAAAEDPDESRYWQQLGQIYEELGDSQAAIEALEQARDVARSGDRWRLDYGLALIYSNLGDIDEARRSAQAALQSAPQGQRPGIQTFIQQLDGAAEPPAPETPPVDLSGERPLAAVEPVARNDVYAAYPPTVIDTARTYEAVIRTAKGDIRLILFDDEAPLTVNNFVFLANQGFYDNTTFHRVIADFMAQAGDPLGNGRGGPGYQFGDETDNGLLFDRPGLLAMANAGPGTNGSQFFITFVPTPHLNGNHTIFGEVIAGEDVLAAIRLRDPQTDTQPGDVIQRIDIVETP